MTTQPRRLWARPDELRARGILGINRRNADFVLPANPRSHYPRVDDKLLSKRFCEERGIPVPETYAIIEQRIIRHAAFERIAVGGTPDIRVVLYRSVPVMAMVRLPTRASRGRANLHQGAVAAAVDLRTGETFGGVCKDRVISEHPDTGATIEGLRIPFWEKLLEAAQKLAEALEMGYVGVDFVLDATVGPVVLEANARPGLAIQVANRCGLAHRLDFLDAQPPEAFAPARHAELVAALSGMK